VGGRAGSRFVTPFINPGIEITVSYGKHVCEEAKPQTATAAVAFEASPDVARADQRRLDQASRASKERLGWKHVLRLI